MTNKWLNHVAQELRLGEIREMFDCAAKIPDVVSLGIGEPDMSTPDPICLAAIQALKEGHTHYSANAGLLDFREAISESALIPRCDYDPEREIISTVGGMGGLFLSLAILLRPGDEVVIQNPAWLNYASQIKFLGGVPVAATTNGIDDFHLKAEAVSDVVTSKTRILIINTPCNPTGAVLSREDLSEIAKVAIQHDLLVISDEVYSTILYDNYKHVSIAELDGMRERTIVINSFSKSFAMTGWRVGFACGPAHLIDKMTRLQENVNACVPIMAQHAGIYALRRMDLAEDMRKIYEGRRNYLVDKLNQIPSLTCDVPAGTFYAFLDVRRLNTPSFQLSRDILKKVGLVTIPGSCFGSCGEGYLRLSFANSMENLTEALTRLDLYVNNVLR